MAAAENPLHRTSAVRGLLLWLCVLGAAVAASAVPGQAVAETAAPPALGVEVTPSRDSVGRQEHLSVFLVVVNKLDSDISHLRVAISNDDFTAVSLPTFPSPLRAYGSAQGTAVIAPTSSAQFAAQKVLFTFSYTWSTDGRQIEAVQGSAVTIQVNRRFEKEATGVLGGGAAFLYLLLPIIPLFLGYRVIDDRARIGRFDLPSMKAEYLLPAFLLAAVVNLLLLVAFRELQLDFSDPVTMLAVLVGSFILGAVMSSLRWGAHVLRLLPWTYSESDSAIQYLRKALLGPAAAETFEWVTGRDARGRAWQGILLRQPSGATALGATFQVAWTKSEPGHEALQKEVFDEDGAARSERRSRLQLVRLLQSGGLHVAGYLDRVQMGSTTDGRLDRPVATRLDGFEPVAQEARQPKALARLVT